MAVAETSVIVRTIGRPKLLKDTLESIARCETQPAEILVIDQSDEQSSAAVIRGLGLERARTIASEGRGRGLALNEGLRHAAHDVVLVVDDDCTVRPDWISVASNAMNEDPQGIITGRVL